ncbi:peptidase [Microbacterium testaceum]|uniref:Trp biosynthesis-associated membrane protein n=1 Tax=Microbacterium testaceum TaxID=2033 RepID=UPI000734451E|nr:Trp biosynthesis-associated membrane protein [Microbacterium testaceum]KTS91367.1 peptidase [Microbacterium testaceum]
MRRPRSLAVVAMLLAGAIGVIGSTQTWIDVTLNDGAQETLAVPGSDALPVLTPLSLAALALGAALSIAGPVVRYVFGAIGLAIAALTGFGAAQIVFATPVSATAATVTDATGISGVDAVGDLVAGLSLTPWPAVTLAAQIVLAAAAIFTLVTARRWGSNAGRKYRTTGDSTAESSRPHDAIDSWDDLSRGDDPTA